MLLNLSQASSFHSWPVLLRTLSEIFTTTPPKHIVWVCYSLGRISYVKFQVWIDQTMHAIIKCLLLLATSPSCLEFDTLLWVHGPVKASLLFFVNEKHFTSALCLFIAFYTIQLWSSYVICNIWTISAFLICEFQKSEEYEDHCIGNESSGIVRNV